MIFAEFDRLQKPQLALFCRFVYYTFCRTGKELTRLKIGDIQQNKIYINAENDKNSRADFVTIPEPLQKIIELHKLRSYPPEFFVFGFFGEPGAKAHECEYFRKRHNEIIRALGFDENYSLYGWKHSGNVALYQATKDISAIQRQNRHSEITTTMKYLRGLGLFENEAVHLIPEI